MQCVILAGGLATRMRPLTESMPKSLVPVLGRPFLDHQLRWLASHGVKEVLFLTGYLGEQIHNYVGDGQKWGIRASFSQEEGTLLGTGGALRQAADRGLLASEFLLTYGDSYLRLDFRAVYNAWKDTPFPALMTIFHNRGSFDRSNVVYRNGRIELYSKEPTPEEFSSMEFIDYGLLAFRRNVIKTLLPPGQKWDLSPLLTDLSRKGELLGLEVKERFFEVGSPEGLKALEVFLQREE